MNSAEIGKIEGQSINQNRKKRASQLRTDLKQSISQYMQNWIESAKQRLIETKLKYQSTNFLSLTGLLL